MSPKMDAIMVVLEGSMMSAAMAVHDHLETVASNGEEYATDEAMLCEAENLKEWAEMVIEALNK